MKARIIMIVIAMAALFFSGCAAQRELSRQEAFLSAAPKSVLIVPVVNKSVDVTAADYMLSTISIPLAERGYYVFPTNMVKRVLEDDGLADSSLVHAAPASRLAKLFGADAVLYVTIERWDAKYMVLNTQVTVAATFEIRDAATDKVIWKHRGYMVHNSDNGGGGGIAGLVVKAVSAAITRGMPNYMPLARTINNSAFSIYPGHGIPFGPYIKAQQKSE